MGSKLGGGEDDLIADINITPFVDIILVVLIIFMVTTSTIVEETIKVTLPDAASAEGTDSLSLGLTLTEDGKILVDGTEVSVSQLESRLESAREESEDVVCLIAADKAVAHGRVIWLIDMVKSKGIGKFAININKAEAVAPSPPNIDVGALPGDG